MTLMNGVVMNLFRFSRTRFYILAILVVSFSCSPLYAGWKFLVLDGNTTPTPKTASGLLDFFAKEKYPISTTAYKLFNVAGMPTQFQYHQYVRSVSFDIGGITIGCYNGSYGSEEFSCIAIRDNGCDWFNTVLKHYQGSCGGLYEGDECMAVAHLAGRLAAQEVKESVIDTVVASFVELICSDSRRENLNVSVFAGGIAAMEVKSGFFGADDGSDIFAKVQPVWEAATKGTVTHASSAGWDDLRVSSESDASDPINLLETETSAAESGQPSESYYNVDDDTPYVPGKKLNGFDKAVVSIYRTFFM